MRSNFLLKAVVAVCVTGSPCVVEGQGTVFFNNRLYGTLITHVYTGPWGTAKAGNGPNDTPPGMVDWSGFTAMEGSGWSAALLAAPGSGAPYSSLVFQAGSVTTFRTGAAAGCVAPLTVTLNGIAKDAPVATFQMVVWWNRAGTLNTWPEALVEWQSGQIWAGVSPAFDVNAIGGDLNGAAVLIGLQSFSISVPEPSAAALLILGLCAAALRRRRC